MIDKAKVNQTLLELHNLPPAKTAEYVTGCLWVLAAATDKAKAEQVKSAAGQVRGWTHSRKRTIDSMLTILKQNK
jgi:hypothetical protein